MRDLRVHIGPETVFGGLNLLPEGLRPLVGQGDLHQRLAGLEAVFPGLVEADRAAILRRQRLAIGADHHEGQLVAGLLDGAGLDIGPGVPALLQAGHHGRDRRGLEADEPGAGLDADRLQQRPELEAGPGHHHRPGLDAAQPIGPLLERHQPQQLVDVEAARVVHHAVDLQHPGPLRQLLRRAVDALVGAELVEVVVGRGVALGGQVAAGRVFRVARLGEGRGAARLLGERRTREHGGGRAGGERAPVHDQRFGRGGACGQFPAAADADQHGGGLLAPGRRGRPAGSSSRAPFPAEVSRDGGRALRAFRGINGHFTISLLYAILVYTKL